MGDGIWFDEKFFFVIFVICWFGSRVILFSWKVIVPVFVYAPSAYSCHFGKFMGFASGLVILLCLHIYWSTTILKVAMVWICLGSSIEDSRSDDEDEQEIIILPEEFSDNDEEESSKFIIENGSFKAE